MSPVRKFNDAFFDEIGNAPGTVSLLLREANATAARARASAPLDTGAYRDGIVVRTRRAAHRTIVEVVATDEKSMLIESETGNLARAGGARG
jgi:hypothetical protein